MTAGATTPASAAGTRTAAAGPPDDAPARRPTPAAPHGLRPEIQALRAVAVLLVFAFHLWPAAIPGGYVGVDVFFVISGFLITSLLLREATRTGTISLAGFWARRARRILPAALVTLLAVAIATAAFVPLNLWTQFFADLRASAAYVQNWHLASAAVDYFQREESPSPVQHFWSLSVEEQFYLVWPLALLAALALTRGRSVATRRRALGGAMGLLTVASFAYGVHRTAADPAAAYFVTPTRAWEFGAGALLAFARPVQRSTAPLRGVVSWLGLVAIAVAALAYTDTTPFPGTAALLPVLGAVAIIRSGAPERRWAPTAGLTARPVQFVGDVSYAVYLWHWPLLILTPYVTGHAVGTVATIAIIVLTFGLAWLTKVLIEDPVRSGAFFTRSRLRWTFGSAALATGIVLAVTAAGTGYVNSQIHKDALATDRVLAAPPACFGAAARDPRRPCTNRSLRLKVIPAPVQARALPNSPCVGVAQDDRVRPCAFGIAPDRATDVVALIGDSHASHWRAAVDAVARSKGWAGLSVTHTSCPLSMASPVIPEPGPSECAEWNAQTLDWLRRHPEISTVFVGQHAGGRVEHDAGVDNFTAQREGYVAAWNAMPKTVRRIVVLRDNPKMRSRTLDCIQRAVDAGRQAGPACAEPRTTALEPDPAAQAATDLHSRRVQVVDLNRYICGPARCYPVVGGALVFKDVHHFTTVFASTLGPYLERQLDRLARS